VILASLCAAVTLYEIRVAQGHPKPNHLTFQPITFWIIFSALFSLNLGFYRKGHVA
jgi:hypothetical protein